MRMLRRLLLLTVPAFSVGCPKTEASKDDDKSEKSSSKSKKGGDDDDISDEDICKKIVKLAKKEKELSDEKVEKLTKKCAKKLAEPGRKKCASKCVEDNDTMDAFEKCDRECRSKDKDKDKGDKADKDDE